MQKGDKNKLALLLTGIKARAEQNQEYFVSMDFQFRSGGKKFKAAMTREGSCFTLTFQGTARMVDLPEALEFFSAQAEQFEESVLIYIERGTVMTITVDKKGVRMQQSEQQASADAQKAAVNPLLDQGRQYLIQVDRAAPLLREIGILTAGGKLKNDMIRKYNQIDHYVELVAPMFESDTSEEIVLLDCACGKSYLSFVMNYYLREVLHRKCRIIGIDINPHVVEESRNMAKRLGYHNMEFQEADLRVYQPPELVTAVISLHACDIATDLALATAIRARAKYIACVPCCHKELLNQFRLPGLSALTRHGIFQARFNDVLTDSLRALKLEAEGYKVSVVEYISPLDSPKNLLIRATRMEHPNPKAREEYEAVTTLLGTNSELDRRCAALDTSYFVTDEDLI